MSESAAGETAAAGVGDATHELPIGVDGETLPAQEIVTGRGFITGKSGAGKSNTVTVVLEELFELGLPALVVDTDGEYWPLRERYDVLHVGGDADADTIVDESDADRLAELAIGDGVPIILDVSAFDADATAAIVEEAVGALFARAKRERRPYLLVVEEIHEYLPQRGSDDLSELLTAVAKRGRKYGLGLVGASQRPASVDKDFITQANWMVWHRLTYETDTGKAAQNLGKRVRGTGFLARRRRGVRSGRLARGRDDAPIPPETRSRRWEHSRYKAVRRIADHARYGHADRAIRRR